MNTWHWLWWVLFHGWRSSLRVVNLYGPGIRALHGVGLARQRGAVLYLALVHNVPPFSYYQFELFRPEKRQTMWAYVFANEAATFHRWRAGSEESAAEIALVADKRRLAAELADLDVRVAETVAEIARGSTWRVLPDSGDTVLFCKPRIGSRSEGVFRAQRTGESVRAWRLSGEEIALERVADFIDSLFGHHDYLVQPLYVTSTELEHLGAGCDEAITLRLITEHHRDRVVPYCAYLEVPIGRESSRRYVPLEIDVADGAAVGVVSTASSIRFGPDIAPTTTALEADAVGVIVPGWDELVSAARTAHLRVPSLFAVAWDFVVASNGPILLEGNTTWATAVPQMICGPILAVKETG